MGDPSLSLSLCRCPCLPCLFRMPDHLPGLLPIGIRLFCPSSSFRQSCAPLTLLPKALLQHGISFHHCHVSYCIGQCLPGSQKDQDFFCPGNARIDQVPLQHDEVIHQDRHDHDGIFGPLGFMNGSRVGQDQLVQFRHVIDNVPVIKADGQLPLLRVHGQDSADISVEDLLVIIVPDLHDPVAFPVDAAAPAQARSPGVQLLLQDLVQVPRSGHAPLHGGQHLDVRGRHLIVGGKLPGNQFRNGLCRLPSKYAALLRIQALFQSPGFHVHKKEVAFLPFFRC